MFRVTVDSRTIVETADELAAWSTFAEYRDNFDYITCRVTLDVQKNDRWISRCKSNPLPTS